MFDPEKAEEHKEVGSGSDKEVWQFCCKLPKVEMHAHINGSIRDSTLLELLETQNFSCGARDLLQAQVRVGERRSLDDCFKLFGFIHSVVKSTDVVTRITRESIEDFAADNIRYVELRTTPKRSGSFTGRNYVDACVEGINQCKKQGLDCNVKLLLSIDRSQSVEYAWETVNLAVEYMKTGDNVVVGVDFSGNPTVGRFENFRGVFASAREAGLKIAVHAAEVRSDEEMDQILDFSPDRLGHALYLNKAHRARLLGEAGDVRTRIPIEVCPTSNICTLRLDSYKEHPTLRMLLDTEHPIAISTDDSGVFSTTLSREYAHVANFFNVDKPSLAQMALSAADHIFATDLEKQELKASMEKVIEKIL